MSENEKNKKFIRIYFRNGFPISAVDSDGRRYSPRRIRHSKHIRNKRR